MTSVLPQGDVERGIVSSTADPLPFRYRVGYNGQVGIPWMAGLASAATAGLLLGCTLEARPVPSTEHRPSLWVTAERRDELLERTERAPYDAILEVIRERATRDYQEPATAPWDHSTIGHNNETAQANAVLAWLFDDEQAAAKAIDILGRMPSDFETNTTWDVNIRMPHVLMTACVAWDLLAATPWLTEAASADIEQRLTTITGQFFERYLENPVTRQLVLGVSQNNHPIRTASAIGMVGITFRDHPQAATWSNWAVSELSYLMGPDGKYLQPDGGVSEGPFYYGFAYGPAIAFFIAMHNAADPNREFQRDCRNRQDAEPWLVTDCVDGEPFVFDNPLDGDLLHATVDWSINLRIPEGWRAPLGDANFNAHNGSVLLTSFGGGGHTRWDFDVSPEASPPMTWGMDLTAHHLAYLDDTVEATEPPWHNRFMPAAGNAVLRSGWDSDARWLLLVAENGAARRTLHDHVDGTSFSLAAYGEYLLLDPGYYKPDELDNAVTADSDSHNTVRIGGQGAPDKGLLLDFGDTDAELVNELDGEALAYVEARQTYQSTTIERSAVFVRQRYFVIADRLETTHPDPRPHAWRLGGWAGYDVPGIFEPWSCAAGPCGARWERAKAGVEVHLAATAPGLEVVEPPYTPLAAPHVGAFDRDRLIQDHGVIDGVVDARAPGFLAVLAPYRVGAAAAGDDAPLGVTALDAGDDAAAWRIDGVDGSEVVWLRGPAAAATLTLPGGSSLASDGALSVLDLAGSFALLARGSVLSVDGATVLTATAGEPVVKLE